jgi:ABC-type sugar transport system substrate-binding protein
MRAALSRHPDASCVVDLGCWTDRTSIATLAATARKRAMKFVTFDQSDAALAAVEAGEIYAVIRDNPFMQGYQAVERLAQFLRGGALALPIQGRGHINVPATVVRQENLANFRAQASARGLAPAA